MSAKSISHCQGKGSLNHNNRIFKPKNVDSGRTSDNVVFVKEPIEKAYEKLFGAAVERYNAKQKRSDRKIKNGYYEYQFNHKISQNVVTSPDKRKHILNCNKNLKASELNQHLPEICNTIKLTDTTEMAETFDDITKRLMSFFKDVGEHQLNFGERRILVVTHAFVIKTILHMFAYSELKNTDKISNSSATVITYDGSDFSVKAVNKLLF